jgi:hypothetical protein
MAEMRNAYRILVGKPEGRNPLRRPGCGWRQQLIIWKYGGKLCIGRAWLRIGTGVGCCVHGNEPPISTYEKHSEMRGCQRPVIGG